MFRLIPPPAHRVGLRLAHGLRKRWWRLRKPRLAGCRVLVLDAEERILLIRHSYGSGKWMVPGGGLGRTEEPVAAAVRELREETACALLDPVLAVMVSEQLHGAGNDVHIIVGRTKDQPRADGREVIEAVFFALHALPDNLAAGLGEGITEWLTIAKAARHED